MDEIKETPADGMSWKPTPFIPIIAIQGDTNKYTMFNSMQQVHTEGNFDKKSHTFLLLNEILYHGSCAYVIEFVDYTFLKDSLKRYLLAHRPNVWQRMFPVNWAPPVMYEFIKWLEEIDCAVQLDISYRESIDAANRDAFYPPNPNPYIPDSIQAWPSAYKDYDKNDGSYNVNSAYGEAFNREPPFRKKWEK
jgi:hypothetical protein